MAAGTKLVLVFETTDGSTTTFSFNYADPGARKVDVIALATAMIANKTLWERQPSAIKSAKTVTTSENEYDVSNLSISSVYSTRIDNELPEEENPTVRSWIMKK